MAAKAITEGREGYYRRNIARGDGAQGTELTISSSVPGVPPGVWHGQAAAALGLAGIVTDAQMRALFGLGMHPDAEAIAAQALSEGATLKKAMRAARLGPAVPQLAEASPLDKDIAEVIEHVSVQLCRPLTRAEKKDVRMRCAARAFTAEYHRAPADGTELARFLAARTGPQRRAVTGYDLTFSSEELSLLFALGGPDVRWTVLEVLAQARSETLSWIEGNALAVRTGPGGVVQQRARPGLLATVYLHYESRAGDPMLHEHAVISLPPPRAGPRRPLAQPRLEAPATRRRRRQRTVQPALPRAHLLPPAPRHRRGRGHPRPAPGDEDRRHRCAAARRVRAALRRRTDHRRGLLRRLPAQPRPPAARRRPPRPA